jgi:hypothetical protein
MKSLILSSLIVFTNVASAYDFKPTQVINLKVENTSGQSDEEALTELSDVISSDSSYRGKQVEITVGDARKVLDLTKTMSIQSASDNKLKMKKPEEGADQWAKNVGAIVKGATSGIEGSATVKVDVSHSEKRPDGTAADTTVKVEVTVSAKK